MTAPSTGVVDLLTIGETMVLFTPPPGGALQLDDAVTVSAGGAESNVAIAAAARGLRTAWYSRIGGGVLGELVLGSVTRHQVNTSWVRVDAGHPTGVMIKDPGAAGSRVQYYRTGSAASTMSAADLRQLPAARVVHSSGIMAAISPSCRDLLGRLCAGALAPARVSFDVNYRPALWSSSNEAGQVLRELAVAADIVFVGRDEAEALWGTSTAEQIRDLFPDVPTLVVKDGAVEAVEFSGSTCVRVPANVVDVVEPVGAGDAFAAGWLSGLLRGDPAYRRLWAAHDAAATVLRSHTDQAPLTAPIPGDQQ